MWDLEFIYQEINNFFVLTRENTYYTRIKECFLSTMSDVKGLGDLLQKSHPLGTLSSTWWAKCRNFAYEPYLKSLCFEGISLRKEPHNYSKHFYFLSRF